MTAETELRRLYSCCELMLTPRYGAYWIDRIPVGGIALLDREFQKEVLMRMRDAYPGFLAFDRTGDPSDLRRYTVNIAYLDEHGLVKATYAHPVGETLPRLQSVRLTAAGYDFLEDDGGLTAVLGVVTVRLHADTVKELLIARVNTSKEPDSVKASMVRAIRNMPAEATKLASVKLMEAGAAHMPDVLGWLRTMTGV